MSWFVGKWEQIYNDPGPDFHLIKISLLLLLGLGYFHGSGELATRERKEMENTESAFHSRIITLDAYYGP